MIVDGNSSIDEQVLDAEFCREYIKKANRGIVKHFPDLEVFSEVEHAAEIRGMAHGMTLREICDFYGITLEGLPSSDKFFLCTMFIKGRVTGTLKATEALFGQMHGREGVKASVSYLSRFADNWQSEVGSDLNLPKAIQIKVID